jgi:hypothetical protein
MAKPPSQPRCPRHPTKPCPGTCASLLPHWSCVNDLRAARRAERTQWRQERAARFAHRGPPRHEPPVTWGNCGRAPTVRRPPVRICSNPL